MIIGTVADAPVRLEEVGAMDADVTHLRADAQENRERILDAARALFAERGLDVGTREIARRAGVGPATLYRRFPSRQALVDAAFAVETQSCRQVVTDACADPDPWHGFATMLRTIISMNARNRGFVAAFLSADATVGGIVDHRRELLRMLAELMRRAQSQGEMRADATLADLVLVLTTALALPAAVAEGRGGLAPVRRDTAHPGGARRGMAQSADRYGSLLVDAFRTRRTA